VKWGKHRTEVTEVTEEGIGSCWPKAFRGIRWLRCENYVKWGKHRTEVTEVTEGGKWGNGVDGRKLFEYGGFGARTT
jgi:hypothetical protein